MRAVCEVQAMMGRKQILKHGDEYDLVFSKPIHPYLYQPGVSREIKRRMNRRARRTAEDQVENRLETELADNNMILEGTLLLNPIP